MRPVATPDPAVSVPTPRILRSRADIDRAVRDWVMRFEADLQDLSVSPEWSLIAAETAGLGECLSVAVIDRADGTPEAVAVFLESTVRMCGVTVRIRELPGNRVMAYHHALVGGHAGELLRAVAEADGVVCDVMLVPSVERGGATDVATTGFAAARGAQCQRVPGVRSPYVPTTGTWEGYLATRSANFRQNLKRKRKALAAHGDLTERFFAREDEVAELIGLIGQVERASWKVGAGMAISESTQEQRYYAALLPWLARKQALCANVLFVGGQAVAYSLSYRWRGRIAQMKTSFDERVSAATPGLTVNATAIRYAFESGAVEFDFLGDVMPHKMHWTDQVRVHDNLYLFLPTRRGRLVGLAKSLIHRLRPHRQVETVGRGGHR